MIELDFAKVNTAAMVLRAFRNKLRKKVLDLIDEKPGITVTEIYILLRLIHYIINQENLKAIVPLADHLAVFFKGIPDSRFD